MYATIISIAGKNRSWDKAIGFSNWFSIAKGILGYGYDFKKVYDTVFVCTSQYAFSVQNPWLAIFYTNGEKNLYDVGMAARKAKYSNKRVKTKKNPETWNFTVEADDHADDHADSIAPATKPASDMSHLEEV